MENRERLYELMVKKRSCLCVGLDPDVHRIPASCGEGVAGMEAFCKAIVSATHDFAVAYKPNLAFFEQYGAEGWAALKRIIESIPEDILVIADAKRGDIGNTAKRYALAMFEELGADAVTVAPYMGADSVKPFIEGHRDHWAIVLALTSNAGAEGFEFHGNPPLYERVIQRCQTWGDFNQMMFVVGATRPDLLQHARSLAPDYFFLVPGVGAQGGSLNEVMEAGWTSFGGLLINASRSILYASDQSDFAHAAGQEAMRMQRSMAPYFESNPER